MVREHCVEKIKMLVTSLFFLLLNVFKVAPSPRSIKTQGSVVKESNEALSDTENTVTNGIEAKEALYRSTGLK